MRIAFVTPEYVTESNFDGGLSSYLQRTVRALSMAGHQCVVVVASDVNDHIFCGEVEVERVAVRPRWVNAIERLLLHRLPVAWLWQARRLNRRLADLEKNQPFDVVQYASYTGTALFRRGTTPALVRLSSVQQLCHRLDGAAPTLRRRLCELIETRSLNHADLLFAPSRLVAERVQADTGRPVAVVESMWIPDASKADYSLYQEELSGIPYLLFFGTLSALKGVAVLAEALPDLLERYPDLHFVAAGKEHQFQGRGMMAHVREAAGAHAGRIRYLGRLSSQLLRPVIDNAAVVVLPSRVDNMPNTCIEAMGLGRVVVATRGASFEQLIEDGENGFLCRKDDPDDLSRVVGKVLSMDAPALHAIGQRAAISIERLSPECILPKLVGLYERARMQAYDS